MIKDQVSDNWADLYHNLRELAMEQRKYMIWLNHDNGSVSKAKYLTLTVFKIMSTLSKKLNAHPELGSNFWEIGRSGPVPQLVKCYSLPTSSNQITRENQA